ncbi:MAG: hypothetical protein ACTS4V_00790 [Candidatus Hodgkinia cicadicola]
MFQRKALIINLPPVESVTSSTSFADVLNFNVSSLFNSTSVSSFLTHNHTFINFTNELRFIII